MESAMNAQMQSVTMTIYPDIRESEEWSFQGYVYGDWVAHETHSEWGMLKDGYRWPVYACGNA